MEAGHGGADSGHDAACDLQALASVEPLFRHGPAVGHQTSVLLVLLLIVGHSRKLGVDF